MMDCGVGVSVWDISMLFIMPLRRKEAFPNCIERVSFVIRILSKGFFW